VDHLIRLTEDRPGEVICLKGNHEDMLLSVIERPGDLTWWINNGGDATLISYGAKATNEIDAKHLKWFASLPVKYDDGQRLFVHAGVDPTKSIGEQTEQTMLWTRARYSENSLGRFIVHGHTPLSSRVPEMHPYRLNLDTGAVLGGPLTAAVFDSEHDGPLAFVTDAGTVTNCAKMDGARPGCRADP
jgi:serine/threonine protein phosphatase 1